MRWRHVTVLLLSVLAACAEMPIDSHSLAGYDAVLLGEQHDDPRHQRTHRDVVQALAAHGQLAALALEMADEGRTTAGLPRAASEADVRAALGWNDEAWPWKAYGPAVMAAVGAGVPVLGANLPRDRMRAAMGDTTLDARLDAAALQAQREAIRVGHCDLLPATQLGPMTRIQVARDRSMAAVIERAAQPGKTVVLLSGAGHADPALGVPRHLPPGMKFRPVMLPRSAAASPRDYCEDLRQKR